MNLSGKSVALYGRFSPGVREKLRREILARSGVVARDLTRRTDLFVVGALALSLIDSGTLERRLGEAKSRQLPVLGERRFADIIAGEQPEQATLSLATMLASTSLTPTDVQILAAFDLIVSDNEMCRFADASIIRTAADLVSRGLSRGEVTRILAQARDLAPSGRHKITITPAGEAALQWENGLTTLEGQGLLPLESGDNGIDELFERAELLEASGNREEAAQLFDQCARADKTDAIALFNLANIRLAQKRYGEAERNYQMAIARDPRFAEARYNLAIALEAQGKIQPANEELAQVLKLEPSNADALFNRAQMLMAMARYSDAKELFERYLAVSPPSEWAAKARKAIAVCAASLAQR